MLHTALTQYNTNGSAAPIGQISTYKSGEVSSQQRDFNKFCLHLEIFYEMCDAFFVLDLPADCCVF